MPNAIEDKLLTVAEAAKRLMVSPALIYGLCKERKIRHERPGLRRGKILIPESALSEYRERVTIDAKPERPKHLV